MYFNDLILNILIQININISKCKNCVYKMAFNQFDETKFIYIYIFFFHVIILLN